MTFFVFIIVHSLSNESRYYMKEVLRYFMEDMTEYEQGEILDYPQVLTTHK